MNKSGTVAIVGKPNVGKSTLFNRIVGERKSIVEDKPGVTRDRLYSKCEWLNQKFNLIDTGGITIKDAQFQVEIRAQVEIAIQESNVIIFVVDGTHGLTAEDEYIAKILYKAKTPIIVAVNKIDSKEKLNQKEEFWTLGLGEPIAISSTHSIGVGDLLDRVMEKLPEKHDKKKTNELSFAIIGRPNVGKSSLINSLLREDRAIVSDIQGTTTDSVDTIFKHNNKSYKVIDTAGIRKRGKIFEKLEKYSVLRAARAIEKSDVTILVIDAKQGIIEQDMNISQIAQESHKGIVIVVNKWDGAIKSENNVEKFKKEIFAWFKFLHYAPIVFVSALEKKGMNKIIEQVEKVHAATQTRVKTSVLNEVITEAMIWKEPSSFNGGVLNILFVNQVAIEPPTFVFFVNNKNFLHFSYKRYLENKLREYFGFEGTPLNLIFRNRSE